MEQILFSKEGRINKFIHWYVFTLQKIKSIQMTSFLDKEIFKNMTL